MLVTGALSAVINNTPVVALFIPVAQEWATRFGYSISKLLMPMNHLVILAGMCTLIGTSTNLIVNSLLVKTVPDSGLSLFSLMWIGLPLTAIGFVYMLVASPWLLPDRQSPVEQLENAREYSVEARVTPHGPLVGRSIAEVGLRSMRFAYVLEISRGERLLTAVGPDEVLQGNDRVTFVGVVDAVNELRRIPGLLVAEDQTYQLNLRHAQRCLVEIVLSPTSPLTGQTVRESELSQHLRCGHHLDLARRREARRQARRRPTARRRYAARRDRSGFRRTPEIQPRLPAGELTAGLYAARFRARAARVRDPDRNADRRELRVGAALPGVLHCGRTHGRNRLHDAFRRASQYRVPSARRHRRLVRARLCAGGVRCCRSCSQAGSARLPGATRSGHLVVLYIATVVMTEMITNNAAGVLMFPIAMAVAQDGNVNFLPYVIIVMVGASAGFITPIGYQTNLMVYGPGGYRWMDYIRFGTPLSILVGIATVLIVPRVWPF
jgi:hypothetical protein